MSGIKSDHFFNLINTKNKICDVWSPNDKLVVLGRFSKEKEDINSTVYNDSLSIVRRPGGGGTVILDEGVLVIDIGLKMKKRNISNCFNFFNNIIIQSLKIFGINAITDDECYDLRIGNRKVGGVSIAIKSEKILYGASLIVNKDTICNIEKYLRIPLKQPRYRRNRSHRDFLVSLDNYQELDTLELIKVLKNNIEKIIPGIYFFNLGNDMLPLYF